MQRGTKTKTTIELNGQLYDARTGKIIQTSVATPMTNPATQSNGRVLDGFIRPSQPAGQPFQAKPVSKPVSVEVNKPVVAPKHHVQRSEATHTPVKLEKSKTLMRPAVKKPEAFLDPKTAPPTFKKENHHRHLRAAAAEKSPLVRRFHPVNQHKIVKKEAVLPVARPNDQLTRQISNQVAHLATSTEARVKQSVDVIEESLQSASSHLETFEDKVAKSSFWNNFGFRNKIANLASLSFAGLLLVGFFGYQNAPNIEMRLAASQSGVAAQMPGYKPSGFSTVRDIQSAPGQVSVSFRSNTDDKKFTVTQQASNWSSDTLLNNHVLASKQPFQTYQDKGKTVYVYENSNATWVNGGVWYRVDGNASLTSDQVLRIASSF